MNLLINQLRHDGSRPKLLAVCFPSRSHFFFPLRNLGLDICHIMDRKAELEKKRQKLAELRKAREERQQNINSSNPAVQVGSLDLSDSFLLICRLGPE